MCTVKVSFDKFEAFNIDVYRPVNGRIDGFLYNLDENFHINLLHLNYNSDIYLKFMRALHFLQRISVHTRFSNVFTSSLFEQIQLNCYETFTSRVISINFIHGFAEIVDIYMLISVLLTVDQS